MRREDFSNWTFHKEWLWEELDFNMYMYMLKEVFQFFIRDLMFNCYLLWTYGWKLLWDRNYMFCKDYIEISYKKIGLKHN